MIARYVAIFRSKLNSSAGDPLDWVRAWTFDAAHLSEPNVDAVRRLKLFYITWLAAEYGAGSQDKGPDYFALSEQRFDQEFSVEIVPLFGGVHDEIEALHDSLQATQLVRASEDADFVAFFEAHRALK